MTSSALLNSSGRIAILGGGISGLSAAWRLSKHIDPSRIVLLEASSRVGGWIHSERTEDGAVRELGPKSIRLLPNVERRKATLELFSETGLDKEIIAVKPGQLAGKRFVYMNGDLLPIFPGIKALFVQTPPYSKPLVRTLFNEFFMDRRIAVKLVHNPDGKDVGLGEETIDEFFRRRFGPDIAENLVGAMCRGIFAGDAKALSMRSCFPDLYEAELKNRSVLRNALFKKREILPLDASELLVKSRKEKWQMMTLRHGLDQLPSTMAKQLRKKGADIRLNSPCERLHVLANKCKIELESGEIEADHVISSLPAKMLAYALSSYDLLRSHLQDILSVTVAVVHLQYEGDVLPTELKGFGYLVPPSQTSWILGTIFDSCVFPDHDAPGKKSTRFTVMMGGHWFHELFGSSELVEEEVIRHHAVSSIKSHLQIDQKPELANVQILKDCIPQYFTGHYARLATMTTYIKERNLPLTLIGSSYNGVSINDCIFNANRAVDQLIA